MSDHELLLAISGMLDTKLKAEFQTLRAELQTLKEELRCIKLYQENVIMPRLNTIGIWQFSVDEEMDCYMRKLESAVQDVRILKVVVAEHSAKLQKLA